MPVVNLNVSAHATDQRMPQVFDAIIVHRELLTKLWISLSIQKVEKLLLQYCLICYKLLISDFIPQKTNNPNSTWRCCVIYIYMGTHSDQCVIDRSHIIRAVNYGIVEKALWFGGADCQNSSTRVYIYNKHMIHGSTHVILTQVLNGWTIWWRARP